MADIKSFYRGDTRIYRFRLKDKEGNPLSVDGGKLTFTLKSEKDLPDSEAEMQVSAIGVEPDPNNPTGEIVLKTTSADTEIPPNKYFYDFQFVSATNDVFTVLPQEGDMGKVVVKPDITRTAV